VAWLALRDCVASEQRGGGVDEEKRGVRLTDEQRIDWLRLIRSENVGPRGIMAQTPPLFVRQPFASVP